MPRNTLKSFPTARLRRGLAHVHPLCSVPTAAWIEPNDPRPRRTDDAVAPPPTAPVAIAPRHDEPAPALAA